MSQNAPSGGDAVNLKTGKPAPKHRSSYDLGYRFADTVRYGFVTPFFKFEGISGDKVSLRSGHNLRTLSLKSPLFQNLRMNKDFYAVPMKALLPLNWDKLFNNPVQGDDVDASKVNTVFSNSSQSQSFMQKYCEMLQALVPTASAVTVNGPQYYTRIIKMLIALEPFCAKNNLFAHFKIDPWHGCKSVFPFTPNEIYNAYWAAFHAWFDKYIELAKAAAASTGFYVDYKDFEGNIINSRYYNFEVMKERIRFYYDILENPYFSINLAATTLVDYSVCNQESYTVLQNRFNGATDFGQMFITMQNALKTSGTKNPDYVNVAPVLAYQMVMYEYFTNDKVDFTYNSDMWRQTIFSYTIMRNIKGQAYSNSTFTWNDKLYQYDAFSRVGLENFIGQFTASFTDAQLALHLSILNDLFGIKRNLKFIDYFTGARMQPIATGDLNVSVTSNKVGVVDISRNIQMQRFLNQVNRIGPDAKNYLKGIFGVEERQHIDVPVKIGHIDETIYGEEVQNTADAQQTEPNSITTNLKSRGSNYAFEFNIAESTIVLGLVSFSIRRYYNNGVSPFSKKVDRFDMFNPYLQFVGDQPIKLEELSSQNAAGLIFGYTGRYAEYKNALDYACGDFVDGALKSWIFSDQVPETQSAQYPERLSPEFIRQDPTELDEYYLNMTGTTPDERYHFIVVFDNLCSASRDMVFNPQILG